MIAVLKTSQFEADFAREALYFCDRDPQVAERFIEAVDAAAELLASQPEIGPVWRYGNASRPTRFILVPGFHNFIIFYRFENGLVRLGRLLHGAQDLGDVLEEQ